MNFPSIVKRINNNVREAAALGLPAMMRHFYGRLDSIADSSSQCRRIHTKFGDVYLRPNDSDNVVMFKIFVDREYDLSKFPQGKIVDSAYRRLLAQGKTPLIVDAGGNIGLAARFFAAQYPDARIVSIEPDRETCGICRKNVENIRNIEVCEAAIGATSGFVTLETERNASWATRSKRSEQGKPVITIADIKARHPDGVLLIVKVDIEGFESDLFSFDTAWVEETTAIIIEPHDWMLPGAGTSRALQRTMMNGDRDMLVMGENLAWIKIQEPAH
jgi:FkbM family methyltransferase